MEKIINNKETKAKEIKYNVSTNYCIIKYNEERVDLINIYLSRDLGLGRVALVLRRVAATLP